MKFKWEITESDIGRVRDFADKHKTPYVENIVNRNIRQRDRVIDKDSMLQAMLICLLSSDSGSNPKETVDAILTKKPLFLTYQNLLKESNIEYSLEEIFMKSGITKYIKKVPGYFSGNFDFLRKTEWDLEKEISLSFKRELSKDDERVLADKVDQGFKGFGSKEARSFLMILGVTRYEIPIDYKLIDWLGNFGFPIRFTKTALQDKLFYQDNRSLSLWYLAGAILFFMADAYVDAHLYRFDENPNLSVRSGQPCPWIPAAESPTYAVCWSIQLSK